MLIFNGLYLHQKLSWTIIWFCYCRFRAAKALIKGIDFAYASYFTIPKNYRRRVSAHLHFF